MLGGETARQRAATTAVFLIALLLPTLAAPAHAEANPVRAAILEPADGSTHFRREAISFKDATTTTDDCPPESWTWKFDDGDQAQGANVTHAYSQAGTYTASVHVVGSCGRRHAAEVTIRVVNAPPEARLKDAQPSAAGREIVLDGSGSTDPDGNLTTYRFSVDGSDFPPQASPLLRLNLTRAGGHTATLVVVDAEGAESGPASLAFTVSPGPLVRIAIEGPGEIVAGGSATYTIQGSDAYGNAVATRESELAYAAPKGAGSDVVRYAEDGVEGTRTVRIVPGALASIAVEGARTLAAGETATYTARGRDTYGNPVELAVESFAYTAPTTPGPAEVCHEQDGVRGCLAIQVGRGRLASIRIEGPESLLAGAEASYTLRGLDAHGNMVPLRSDTLTVQAPTQAGPFLVAYEEDGIHGEKTVQVLSGRLASIRILGPESLVAGTSAKYGLEGYDSHGNGVPLAQARLTYMAPTTAGPATLEYAEQNVSASLSILVIADALHQIAIDGPPSLVADHTGLYVPTGADQYGNAVALSVDHVVFRAPGKAGEAFVVYEEQGVRGEAIVTILPDALTALVVTGPDTVVRNETTWFNATGSDQHGNPVPVAGSPFAFTPTALGASQACLTEAGVTGCKNVTILSARVVRVVVTPSSTSTNLGRPLLVSAAAYDAGGNVVADATLVWSASLGTLAANGTYTPTRPGLATLMASTAEVSGSAQVVVSSSFHVTLHLERNHTAVDVIQDGIRGSFQALYLDGGPVAHARATVTVTRVTPGPFAFPPETAELTTDAEGRAIFQVALPSGLPGEYRVSVSMRTASNSGFASSTYVVRT